uniref:ATP-dependent DNA helicase n=1 Tax=Glycine max TaxID=3847 RepID=A0A0R0IT09_SOYBN
MYIIEFQKRRLPHSYILLQLDGENQLHNRSDIDKIISAEVPNPDLYPKLLKAVATYMMHGPYGLANLKSPCTKERKCSKYFPKKFENSTTIDDDGYPCHRRRDMRMFVQKNGVTLDNRNVIPYYPLLLMKYKGHIITKYCNKSNSTKYLFKYVTNGLDRATIEITNSKGIIENCIVVDEINRYYDCRYLSPCEVAWRIFSYDIHERWPTMIVLITTVSKLSMEKSVYFQDTCYALGLLMDDREYIDAIKEANEMGFGNQLRRFLLQCLHIEDNELKELCLIEIEKLLNSNGRYLKDYISLTCPNSSNFDFYGKKFIVEQLNYDTNELTELHATLLNQIIEVMFSDHGQFFFLYGYGGTRNTFLWNTLSTAIRAQKKIVLNVASSDIANLLLPGGMITHSSFSIPLLMIEESTCNIAQGNLYAKKGSKQDILNVVINSSDLWNHCKALKLTKTMRLTTAKTNQTTNKIRNFVDWILQISNGDMDSYDKGEGDIEIPTDLLVLDNDKPLLSLVDFVYSNILENLNFPNFFEERAILAPTLEMLKNSDSPCHFDEDYEIQGDWFTPEFLNEIKCSGIPNHKLQLKVGVLVMLLRNLDQTNGLCRLQVKQLGKNVIIATILISKNYGDTIFIARMDLVPSDPSFPFKFQHRQFPLTLCFVMTINKSKGKSLFKVGLYLPKPMFTHGQLYVAISRVKSKDG